VKLEPPPLEQTPNRLRLDNAVRGSRFDRIEHGVQPEMTQRYRCRRPPLARDERFHRFKNAVRQPPASLDHLVDLNQERLRDRERQRSGSGAATVLPARPPGAPSTELVVDAFEDPRVVVQRLDDRQADCADGLERFLGRGLTPSGILPEFPQELLEALVRLLPFAAQRPISPPLFLPPFCVSLPSFFLGLPSFGISLSPVRIDAPPFFIRTPAIGPRLEAIGSHLEPQVA
jgi:hypothetical protein